MGAWQIASFKSVNRYGAATRCAWGLGGCWTVVPNVAHLWRIHGRLVLSIAYVYGYELRPGGKSGIGRAFYRFLAGQRVVVLHAFIKKSQETPERELKLARKRMKEVLHG